MFTPELVEQAGAQEQRRRLSARLVVYLTLALWLFRDRNCGYRQVMAKLADGLYHQRGAGLLEGSPGAGGWVDAGQGRMGGGGSGTSRTCRGAHRARIV